MNRTERARWVQKELSKVIKRPTTELAHVDPFQLLVAVVLSAQCTDARVNTITPELFQAFPDVRSMAAAGPDAIFPFISSISYPNNKSRHLAGLSEMLMADFDGQVPNTVTDLRKLPGVGQKTAQVVASVAFDVPTLAVDTHVFRVAHRTGLVTDGADTPERVEKQLKRLYLERDWGEVHHLLILHGRYTCTARKPQCESCTLSDACVYAGRYKKLPAPVMNLETNRGIYYCATRKHYFDHPDHVTDRLKVSQISCPRCGSMNVFRTKTGQTTRRIRDYRV